MKNVFFFAGDAAAIVFALAGFAFLLLHASRLKKITGEYLGTDRVMNAAGRVTVLLGFAIILFWHSAAAPFTYVFLVGLGLAFNFFRQGLRSRAAWQVLEKIS